MKVLRKFFSQQSVAVTAARTNELILFEMIVDILILMTSMFSFTSGEQNISISTSNSIVCVDGN